MFSFGGGVQSVAVMVLTAQGRVQYDRFLFANVGDDSENPDTLVYLDNVARPYASKHGIELEEVRRENGKTLYEWVTGTASSIYIPMYTKNGPPGRRSCTNTYKRQVLQRWHKQHGATAENPSTVGIGISVDEFQRARTSSDVDFELLEYPLLDLHLNRSDCRRIIEEAGLPQPPKSSCWFCPFKKMSDWRALKHDHPDLFDKAAALETQLSERSVGLGRKPLFICYQTRPLEDLVAGEQMTLEEAPDAGCDSGYCFT